MRALIESINALADMCAESIKCVLLADRHHGLSEGVRGLLETVFEAVVMVADQNSLLESAARLQPTLAVVDLSLTRGDSLAWLGRLRARCPALKIIALSVHDEPSVRTAALNAGADGVVLKRAIATELLPAIDAILREARKPELPQASPPGPIPGSETPEPPIKLPNT